MKRTSIFLCLIILLFGQSAIATVTPSSNQPDSVYLFSYATAKNSNTNGLHFAWSTDQENWNSIGPEMRFLFSDYGSWGIEKRMITPFLLLAPALRMELKRAYRCLRPRQIERSDLLAAADLSHGNGDEQLSGT